MARVLLSENKSKLLAEKCGIDPSLVDKVWHRGDHSCLIFHLKDGTGIQSKTPKQIRSEK